jgi:calcineurin-like phosphoesterase family protein
MSNVWFSSDHHFFHKNILVYQPVSRPFATLEEMHEIMIERWNNLIKRFDKVYHLGDFAFGRANISIAARLNGNKRLILGNHDAYPMEEYAKYFKSIHGALHWNDCVLTHIPVHTSELEHRSKYNIHGHKHLCSIDDPRYINVNCDVRNLTPINADELFK